MSCFAGSGEGEEAHCLAGFRDTKESIGIVGNGLGS